VDQGLSGEAATDLPVMLVAEATSNQPGPRGILFSNMTGSQARRVTAMRERERISFTLQTTEQLFPGISRHFEGGISKCWDDGWVMRSIRPRHSDEHRLRDRRYRYRARKYW
jgi:monoamine oxidase